MCMAAGTSISLFSLFFFSLSLYIYIHAYIYISDLVATYLLATNQRTKEQDNQQSSRIEAALL